MSGSFLNYLWAFEWFDTGFVTMLELEIVLLLLLAGSAAGLIAGLFGVGGGIVVIPVTLWVLDMQGVSSGYIQHLAIGTSFSVMMFTTFISSWGHYKKKSIRWDILKPMVPGIILGSVGGVFNVPFMLSCKVPVKQAIGTSAALSWGIAFTGAISYLVSGLKVDNLPEGSLGFCYLPIALVLVVTTSIFAPLGVRLAHRLSSDRLQIVFGILLFAVTTQILFKWVL